jgi:hypothetical protein
VHQVQEPRLDELRLGQRRGDAQDRLVGETDGAFGQRVHVAGEAQSRQLVEEARREAAAARHPRHVDGVEA